MVNSAIFKNKDSLHVAMALSSQPIHKASYVLALPHYQPGRFIQEFVPQAILSTVYSSNERFTQLISEEFSSGIFAVNSSIGMDSNTPKGDIPVFQLSQGNHGYNNSIHSIEGDKTKQFKGDL